MMFKCHFERGFKTIIKMHLFQSIARTSKSRSEQLDVSIYNVQQLDVSIYNVPESKTVYHEKM